MKLVIFASGNGSNADKIINWCQQSESSSVLELITDQKNAYCVKRAQNNNIPCSIFEIQKNRFNNYKEAKQTQELLILKRVKDLAPDYIILAGYMRILSNNFVRNFFNDSKGLTRIVNIHPSLLPSFKGSNGYLDAFNYGVKISGITIHFVVTEVDTGPIILQKHFPRFDSDTLETFKARGMSEEHKAWEDVLPILEKDNYKYNKNCNLITIT